MAAGPGATVKVRVPLSRSFRDALRDHGQIQCCDDVCLLAAVDSCGGKVLYSTMLFSGLWSSWMPVGKRSAVDPPPVNPSRPGLGALRKRWKSFSITSHSGWVEIPR